MDPLTLDAKCVIYRFHSPDGRCYSYDSRASGYARGEGVVTLILKPLSSAIRDGNPIRAIIRGTSVNSDGRTAGITMPSQSAQECLIRQAYERAGLDPVETIFVEGHGTGTQVGDPIEVGALATVFGKGREGGRKLWLGSVKTNLGHLEGASGLAGVVKAVLMVEKGEIVPNLNFVKANPGIKMEEWNIKVRVVSIYRVFIMGVYESWLTSIYNVGSKWHEVDPVARWGSTPHFSQ